MKTLKERLLAAQGRRPKDAVTDDPDIADLTRRIRRLRTSGAAVARPLSVPDDQALADALGGSLVAPGLLCLERRLGGSQRHGNQRLSALEQVSTRAYAGAAPGLSDWVFLDTETTGLAGGSGTHVFMLGLARYREGELRLCQYLITRFDAESAMLQQLTRWITDRDTLVSYNGKSYDLPLLSTRYRLNSLHNPLAGRPHLDLLHPLRRRFARQWDNCRLATVEQRLLGFRRDHDLPGSQAPRAWKDYLNHRHWQNLQGVARHNRLDLLSLALLLPALQRHDAGHEELPLLRHVGLRAIRREASRN